MTKPDMSDYQLPEPRTARGREDLMLFGNAFELERPDGSWEYIPLEDVLSEAYAEDPAAQQLLDCILDIKGVIGG